MATVATGYALTRQVKPFYNAHQARIEEIDAQQP